MITDNKILKYIDRIKLGRQPITADIFLTNYCNNNCGYCTYKRWQLDKGHEYMKFEDFVKYAKKLKEIGVEGFILTGGGEPTLNPDFEKITNFLEANKYSYGINTNFNVLKKIKPTYLKISLDGYSEDSYEKARGVRKYNITKDNIIEYCRWKRKAGIATKVGIQFVAENVDNLIKFYENNKDLDVDYISIRPVESTAGKYYFKTRDKEIEEINQCILGLANKDKRVVRNFKWDLLTRHEEDCTANWAQIAVNQKGEVMYCCHKPYQIIGHIMDGDILSKKNQARTDMSMCDIPCRMTAPNKLIAEMRTKEEDGGFI